LKDRAWVSSDKKVRSRTLKDEIRKCAEDIWGGSETVTIDRTGQIRTLIDVGKDRKLKKVEKEITRAYKTNVEAYADMLARTSTHGAYKRVEQLHIKRKGRTCGGLSGP